MSLKQSKKKRLSLYSSPLTHPAGAYPGFQIDEATWSITTPSPPPPEWEANPSQGYPPAFHQASLTIDSTHLYSEWRGRHSESKVS